MIDNTFLVYATDTLADTTKGFTGGQIEKLMRAYSIDYNISIDSRAVVDFPNKRTALLEYLKSFPDNLQFKIINELSKNAKFIENKDIEKMKDRLLERFGAYYLEVDTINAKLMENTSHFLGEYPKSLELYNKAIGFYNSKRFHRNCLDDLRLSLELLLKTVFNNDKSLENQKGNIGSFLSSKSISPELRNMFNTLIDYYGKYQNTYVKHNDNVNEDEIDAIFDLTSIFLRFIIKNAK